MSYSAKVVLDSVSSRGVRLTTLEACFPRLVLSEFNTHRKLSRNSASSRAIPIHKRIKMALDDPYVPTVFGSNQKGMSSGDPLEGLAAEKARDSWLRARDHAVVEARVLAELGVHKEYANRLLEPFLWHTAIITATEFENFFNLRCHPNATEPFRVVAEMMRGAMVASVPSLIGFDEWHLPYVTVDDLVAPTPNGMISSDHLVKVSVGRCARVSYLTHDGRRDQDEDVRLHDTLLGNGHMSPLEHVARPAEHEDLDLALIKFSDLAYEVADDPYVDPAKMQFGNFTGWVQYRKTIPGEAVFQKEAV